MAVIGKRIDEGEKKQEKKVKNMSVPAATKDHVLVPQPLHRIVPKVGRRSVPQYVVKQVKGDCSHPKEALSTKGTNQFGQRITCMACGSVLKTARCRARSSAGNEAFDWD